MGTIGPCCGLLEGLCRGLGLEAWKRELKLLYQLGFGADVIKHPRPRSQLRIPQKGISFTERQVRGRGVPSFGTGLQP